MKKIKGLRKTFVGVFERYGSKTNWHGFPENTILLVKVKDGNSKIVADHIWFRMTKGFEKLGELKDGDRLQFDARVKPYVKGYVGYREEIRWEKPPQQDYKLNNPTKIKRLI